MTMSCDDLDRLRSSPPGSHSSNWPPEAQQHLKSCAHCSKLQAALESSENVAFTEDLQQRIEAAIIPDLRPVAPLASVWLVILALVICSVFVIAVANWRLGLAGWHARSALQATVNFVVLGLALFSFANTLAH